MGPRLSLCYQHNLYNPIGKVADLKEDDYGLKFTARISDAEPGIKAKIKEGILKEFSIGYSVVRYEMQNVGEDVTANLQIKRIEASAEISLVTLAANEHATLQGMKAAFGINSLEEKFDPVIAIERDQNKKFELLKLKHIALSSIEPPQSTQDDKPQMTKEEEDKLRTYLTLF